MTSERCAKHLFAGQNTQQWSIKPPIVLFLKSFNTDTLKIVFFVCFSDQQLQILEILQNNGEQLFPDEHGEVEIEIAKCCLGSVKQVRL